MSMKILLPVLLILLLLSFGLVIKTELQGTDSDASSTLNSGESTTAAGLLAQEPLVTYTSVANGEGNRIKLQHPPTAEVNQFNDEILIEYFGFNDTLNTQITDGYRLVVVKHPGQKVDSFFSQVDSVIAAQPIVVNKIEGYTYLTPSELGDGALEHVIFAPNENLLLEIQYVVAGNEKVTYRDIVWAIIQSIEVME